MLSSSISMVWNSGSLRLWFHSASCLVPVDDRIMGQETAKAIHENRYDCSSESSIWYVTEATLKVILHFTGNQCRCLSVRDMLMQPLWRVTRAKVCWIRWSYKIYSSQTPSKIELALSSRQSKRKQVICLTTSSVNPCRIWRNVRIW